MRLMTKIKVYGVAGIAVFGLMNNPFDKTSSEAHSLAPGEIYNSLDGEYAAPQQPATPQTPMPGLVPETQPGPPSLNSTNTSFDCKDFKPNVDRPDNVAEDTFQAIMCAEAITGVDAGVLRGISAVECGDGFGKARDAANHDKICRDPGTSNSAGASGPMQFLPCTWDNFHRGRNGCWKGDTGRERAGQWGELTGPAAEAGRPGHGADGNGDGIADPWNVYDSALASAIMVKKSVHNTGDIHRTLQEYNGGQITDRNRAKTNAYAIAVLEHAGSFSRSIGR